MVNPPDVILVKTARCFISRLEGAIWKKPYVCIGAELGELIAERGWSKMTVSDNGTALTSNAVLAWSGDAGVEWHYIAPGKPTQNRFVESFDGRMTEPPIIGAFARSSRRAGARFHEQHLSGRGQCGFDLVIRRL